MASREADETSFFGLSGVRERMREKKKGALRTAKLNASLASKIKTKIINNSSTIKVSLKHNNKALALALNAEKALAQRLTQEKSLLQKEVEQCHFQNAVLRHRLSFLSNILKEIENLMAAVKMAQLSEFRTNSVSLSSGQKCSMTEDSWADDIADGQLLRVTGGIPMRVPISKLRDAGEQGDSSTAVQTSSGELQRPALNEPLKIVPVASEDTLPPQQAEKPQSHQEENRKKFTEAMETQEAFLDSCIFGEVLCTTKQNPKDLPALAWESHLLPYEDDEMAKCFFDRLSQGHVTQRRKRSTLFATSTSSPGVGIFPCVSSTQAALCSITKDSSSSSKSNTQQQLESPSCLASPTQTTVISDRKSVRRETFCDQPQAKETECDLEVDPNHSQVPEFVPVKVKSKSNRKTGEKTMVKKASTGKKKTNKIKNNAKSSPDISQSEERAQNAKTLLQPKAAMCSTESEVCELGQKACVVAFDRKNRDSGVEHHYHSPDGAQDLESTYVVNPAQLSSLESGDLMQHIKKGPFSEIQSTESLLKSPVHTYSSHEVPSVDSSPQNSHFFGPETSSACALQEDSSVSTKNIRPKTNRRTRVIRPRVDSDEEYLPKSVKIQNAKAEEEPKRSQTRRKKTVRLSNCDQRNEVDFGPCISVQGVAKESTKDLPCHLKHSRRTYVVYPLDPSENLDCIQTEFEGSENVPPRSVPGIKGSKIPRAAKNSHKSNKKQTGGLQKEGQANVDNLNDLKKEACCKPKPQRKNSRPLETDCLARKSDGAKVPIGSSTELASKQSVLMGKFLCIADLLSEPDGFLEEQIPEISLTNSLLHLPHSPEFSSVTSCAALPVSSGLTEVPVSKSLSTEDNRMPAKSPDGTTGCQPKSSLTLKEQTAKEMPGERNQVQSNSWSSPSQEPEIRPLRDLNDAGILSYSSSERVSGHSSRRRRNPACYKEPKLNSKLRRGDPFTDTKFLHYSSQDKKRKKPVKAKEMTQEMEEQLPEGCPSAKVVKFVTMERSQD